MCAAEWPVTSESALIGVAAGMLGDAGLAAATPAELGILHGVEPCANDALLNRLRRCVAVGADPLGDAFETLREPTVRRARGQVFTPPGIVNAMIARAKAAAEERGDPERIVDGGAGTGRFLMAAGRVFARARLVAGELDPVCALLLRANLHAAGQADRADVQVADYRELALDPINGRTLFIGNPPYVRHHAIGEEEKRWYAVAAAELGQRRASKLAGLHLHFFVKTGLLARPGDLAILVTAAEWLDTGYGGALRALLCGRLGGVSLHAVDARANPFPGTLTTAAITVFQPGTPTASLRFQAAAEVSELSDLSGGRPVDVAVAAAAERWPPLSAPAITGKAKTRIGDHFRVSRGQVTGMNRVWLDGNGPSLPDRFLYSCITGADEIFAAAEGGGKIDPANLKRAIDLPRDLSELTDGESTQVGRFLDWARNLGAHLGYIARHRTPWWSIRLKAPAPIVCTYMARRPPAFALNPGVRLLNIAHGLHPLRDMTTADLHDAREAIVKAVGEARGRIYAGGLIKWEPRAMEAVEIAWKPSFT